MDTVMAHLLVGRSPELAWCASRWFLLRQRLDALPREEGMTTETVIITAGLAALAVSIVVIIGARVRDRASSIP